MRIDSKQVLSSLVETEQRIWLRRKWTPQIAVIETSGMLMISSPSRYDKREYLLAGAQALLIDREATNAAAPLAPLVCIALNPSLQPDGTARVAFRLAAAADAVPWIAALSRLVKPVKPSVEAADSVHSHSLPFFQHPEQAGQVRRTGRTPQRTAAPPALPQPIPLISNR